MSPYEDRSPSVAVITICTLFRRESSSTKLPEKQASMMILKVLLGSRRISAASLSGVSTVPPRVTNSAAEPSVHLLPPCVVM